MGAGIFPTMIGVVARLAGRTHPDELDHPVGIYYFEPARRSRNAHDGIVGARGAEAQPPPFLEGRLGVAIDRICGSNQGKVRERLREVPGHALLHGVVFLGHQPQFVGVGQQLVH